MDMGLEEKVAVISRGSVGTGLAVAEALAEEGAHLVICARDEARVKEYADTITGKNGVRTLGVSAGEVICVMGWPVNQSRYMIGSI